MMTHACILEVQAGARETFRAITQGLVTPDDESDTGKLSAIATNKDRAFDPPDRMIEVARKEGTEFVFETNGNECTVFVVKPRRYLAVKTDTDTGNGFISNGSIGLNLMDPTADGIDGIDGKHFSCTWGASPLITMKLHERILAASRTCEFTTAILAATKATALKAGSDFLLHLNPLLRDAQAIDLLGLFYSGAVVVFSDLGYGVTAVPLAHAKPEKGTSIPTFQVMLDFTDEFLDKVVEQVYAQVSDPDVWRAMLEMLESAARTIASNGPYYTLGWNSVAVPTSLKRGRDCTVAEEEESRDNAVEETCRLSSV